MSWFSNVGSFAKDFSEKVQSSVQEISAHVPVHMPVIDPKMIEKLTLSSPELLAERQKLDEEELRKEDVKNSLSGMLPWETYDTERDILVEDCKEAILKLSSTKDTFFGPYAMPNLAVKIENDDANTTNNTASTGSADNEQHHDKQEDTAIEGTVEQHQAVEGHQQEQIATKKNRKHNQQPTQESLEKLSKLEPLPALLSNFDLDSHVGLIQKLLKEDPKLVEMQSSLSGGGLREQIFWKNYFFHCAFARYEAGLSIDEIWSDQPKPQRQPQQPQNQEGAVAAEQQPDHPDHEETITFQEQAASAGTTASTDSQSSAFKLNELDIVANNAASSTTAADATVTGDDNESQDNLSQQQQQQPLSGSAATSEADFELIGANMDDIGDLGDDLGSGEVNAFDAEMDELEAEIARELEED